MAAAKAVKPHAKEAQRALRAGADPERARNLARFFQTQAGGYGEGDRFIGLKVPQVRGVAKSFRTLPLPEIAKLLASGFHEDRHLAVFILAHQAERADEDEGRRLAEFYLKHRARINNWDLIDASAPRVLGNFLDPLAGQIAKLARSSSVWDRRIATLAHMPEIAEGKTDRYFRFAKGMLRDEHDLIHKAVGWLLRECGESDPAALRAFLKQHGSKMPRTMLRYAIEKFTPAQRTQFMALGAP
jgi:3-methyladenine DNA glycosylase AlkD